MHVLPNDRSRPDEARPVLILDDGRYYVALEPAAHPTDAAGFLHVRSSHGCRVPGDHRCLGHFSLNLDQTWQVRLSVPYDPYSNSDSLHVGDYDNRLNAIAALWQLRKEASLPFA